MRKPPRHLGLVVEWPSARHVRWSGEGHLRGWLLRDFGTLIDVSHPTLRKGHKAKNISVLVELLNEGIQVIGYLLNSILLHDPPGNLAIPTNRDMASITGAIEPFHSSKPSIEPSPEPSKSGHIGRGCMGSTYGCSSGTGGSRWVTRTRVLPAMRA